METSIELGYVNYMSRNGRLIRSINNIYAGFSPFLQEVLRLWEDRVTSLGDQRGFYEVVERLNQEIRQNNIVLFFDHHYAFDALPLGVAVGNYIGNNANVIVPYAVHLDMGLGREGEFSIRYWIRTKAFHWFVKRIKKGNPQIEFYPVVREFELETPRLRSVVDNKFQGINTAYLRTFIRQFSDNPFGQICFLTPFSGIGFPGKSILHRQLFRSIKIVLSKTDYKVSYFITGAYPNWDAYQNYFAPLFMEHKILLRGPFSMETREYAAASAVVENELGELRKAAAFTPPDYSKLLMK
jgi:hypothetical protein